MFDHSTLDLPLAVPPVAFPWHGFRPLSISTKNVYAARRRGATVYTTTITTTTPETEWHNQESSGENVGIVRQGSRQCTYLRKKSRRTQNHGSVAYDVRKSRWSVSTRLKQHTRQMITEVHEHREKKVRIIREEHYDSPQWFYVSDW